MHISDRKRRPYASTWLQLPELDDASVCNDAGDETGARLELASKDSVGEAVREEVHSSVSGNLNGLANQRGTRRWSPHYPQAKLILWVKRRFVGPSEQCTKPTLINQTF